MALRDLPDASGQQIVACLTRHFDMRVDRMSNLGHWILSRPGYRFPISIPNHRRVKRPLLAAVLRVVGIDHKEFTKRI